MAIVIRYFSTTGAGAADGTTWADRAALFSSGNWSSVITGFNFSLSDSLECRIEGGLTYTCGALLQASSFTNAPTAANPLMLHAADASGNRLAVPDPRWRSAQPIWDITAMPTIATTANVAPFSVPHLLVRLLRFTASGRNAALVSPGTPTTLDWCVLRNETSGTSVIGLGISCRARNTVVQCTGTAFSYVGVASGDTPPINCRFEGNSSAATGNREGVVAATPTMVECTITGCTTAVRNSSASVGTSMQLERCVIAGNSSDGVRAPDTASQTSHSKIARCVIAGNGGYGINCGTGFVLTASSRLRSNTSGNFNATGNYPTDLDIDTSAGADADEFVDAANGDYRIKYGSALWGKGIGAGDGPATITG